MSTTCTRCGFPTDNTAHTCLDDEGRPRHTDPRDAELAALHTKIKRLTKELWLQKADASASEQAFKNTLANMVQRESYVMRETERDQARAELAEARREIERLTANAGVDDHRIRSIIAERDEAKQLADSYRRDRDQLQTALEGLEARHVALMSERDGAAEARDSNRQMLASANAEIDRLHNDVAGLESSLKELRVEHDAAVEWRDKYTAIIDEATKIKPDAVNIGAAIISLIEDNKTLRARLERAESDSRAASELSALKDSTYYTVCQRVTALEAERDAALDVIAMTWKAIGITPEDAAEDPDTSELYQSVAISLAYEKDQCGMAMEQNVALEKRLTEAEAACAAAKHEGAVDEQLKWEEACKKAKGEATRETQTGATWCDAIATVQGYRRSASPNFGACILAELEALRIVWFCADQFEKCAERKEEWSGPSQSLFNAVQSARAAIDAARGGGS